QLVASIDSKEYAITEASVRSKLQLTNATGIQGYAGDIIPLRPAMLAGAVVDQGEGSAQPAEPHHTHVDPIPSPHPSPLHQSPPPPSPLHQSPPPPSPPHPSPPHPSPLNQSPPHSPPQSPPHFSPSRSYEAPLPEG
ncbi:hypothetical protein Tco_0376659, partial [Tanacetum coccineum]